MTTTPEIVVHLVNGGREWRSWCRTCGAHINQSFTRDVVERAGEAHRCREIPTRNLQVAVTFKSDPFVTGAEIAARLLRQIADELVANPEYPKWRTVFLDGEDVGRYKLHEPEEAP